jgi:hypothetical protein
MRIGKKAEDGCNFYESIPNNEDRCALMDEYEKTLGGKDMFERNFYHWLYENKMKIKSKYKI